MNVAVFGLSEHYNSILDTLKKEFQLNLKAFPLNEVSSLNAASREHPKYDVILLDLSAHHELQNSNLLDHAKRVSASMPKYSVFLATEHQNNGLSQLLNEDNSKVMVVPFSTVDLEHQLRNTFSTVQLQNTRPNLEKHLEYLIVRSTLYCLAHGINHEINNPLTIAGGMSQMLIDTLNDSGTVEKEALAKGLSRIERSTTRITRYSHNILLLSEDHPRALNIHTFIEDILLFYKDFINQKQIKVTIKDPDFAIEIKRSPAKVGFIVYSIIKNAGEAIPKNVGEHSKWINIEFIFLENQIDLVFTDSGKFDQTQLKHYKFKPFTTSKDPATHLGMGLYLIKKICEESGDQLFLEANQEGHTQVRVRFKLS